MLGIIPEFWVIGAALTVEAASPRKSRAESCMFECSVEMRTGDRLAQGREGVVSKESL